LGFLDKLFNLIKNGLIMGLPKIKFVVGEDKEKEKNKV